MIGQHPRSHMDTRYANLIYIILYKFTAYHKHFIFLPVNYGTADIHSSFIRTKFLESVMIDQVLHYNITMNIENHYRTLYCE